MKKNLGNKSCWNKFCGKSGVGGWVVDLENLLINHCRGHSCGTEPGVLLWMCGGWHLWGIGVLRTSVCQSNLGK